MPLLDTLADIPRATQPLPWLVTAGQPSADQLRHAQEAGVGLVIDLRDPMESRPFDEPATVRTLGMRYVNVPTVSGALTEEMMDEILAALRSTNATPALLHCASANRVGGPLIAYLMLDEGMSEQDAVNAAMRAGLRSPEMIEWAVGYARKQR
jgi:protein tyrosine phosphatase (PTP) superfamily phosphohydrolase (DUF442 family)